ncbi:MAG: type II secretion system F family protein [Nostocoides sp.]
MIGLLLGLGLGSGLFLVWWSCWEPTSSIRGGDRRPAVIRRVADDLAQAGYESMSPRTLLGACGAALVLVFLIAFAISAVPMIALCFAVMAAWSPIALVRMRARKRRGRLRDLWPDVVDNVTSAVRAGMALPEALAQLAIRGPEELRPAFASFAHDYRTTGRFNDCLNLLKLRLGDPVGDRLVESLRIAREVGGSDLGQLLRTLSTFLREDARTRAELEARQSWTVNAAKLAVAAPWVVLAMLSTRPESVTAYSSRLGGVILLVGAGLTVVAYRAMMRLGRLPLEERVLR